MVNQIIKAHLQNKRSMKIFFGSKSFYRYSNRIYCQQESTLILTPILCFPHQLNVVTHLRIVYSVPLFYLNFRLKNDFTLNYCGSSLKQFFTFKSIWSLFFTQNSRSTQLFNWENISSSEKSKKNIFSDEILAKLTGSKFDLQISRITL